MNGIKLKIILILLKKKNKKFNLVKLTTDQPEILNITQFFKEKMNEIKIPKIESKIENESIKNFFNFLIVNAFSSRFGNNQRINYYSRNQNYDDDEDEEYESDKKNSNFAIFKKETLNKAYEILNEIGKNINK